MQYAILGAPDKEMAQIQQLLTMCGVQYAYAAAGGKRCHGGNAYKSDSLLPGTCSVPEVTENDDIILVECELPGWFSGDPQPAVVVIDHHKPGHYGYGKPPEEFFEASSLGQLYKLLRRMLPITRQTVGTPSTPAWLWESDDRIHVLVGTDPHPNIELGLDNWFSVPIEAMVVAAADHCLGAAYHGQCPGVDPEELRKFRIKQIAEFRGMTEEDVSERIELAILDILASPRLGPLSDMRGKDTDSLPEAAAIIGRGYVTEVTEPTGRRKIVIGGRVSPEVITKFLEGTLINGLIDHYGDPTRGFAGAYYKG